MGTKYGIGMPGLAYLNGRFLLAAELHISPLDAGFVWGATVTDRVRTYGHKPYLLAEHVARFRRSCELCRIPQPMPDDEIIRAAEHLVAENTSSLPDTDELVLILFATPGEDRRDGPRGSLAMHTMPLDVAAYRPLLERGARLVTPAIRQAPVECLPRIAKMRSRMTWWLAEQQVRDVDPGAAAFLLDLAGNVTETAAANFVIVRDDTVVSPPRSTILDGISLGVVESLSHEFGLRFVEQELDLAACHAADEALLTSTPFGIAGVSAINGRALPWPGPILGRLHDSWCTRLGREIWRPMLPDR